MTMPLAGEAPAEPGAYLLWFELPEPLTLSVGRLGDHLLPAGCFAYAGSALGPGGLRSRLRRHVRPFKRCYWHVDYLTALQPPTALCFQTGRQRLECAWVQALRAAGAGHPIVRFGNGDCRQGCQAHLLQAPSHWTLELIEDLLQ